MSAARRRLRASLPLGALVVALLLPASASGHGRNAIVALDYRLTLDPNVRELPGVSVSILDGDRDFQVTIKPGVRLLVRGELGEPFLRLGPGGIWANGSSPTATADRVIPTGLKGWVRLSGGDSVVWHDHRLAPPPSSTVGPDGSFAIPISVDGRPATIAGTFFRVARPALWPWLLAAVALGGGILSTARRRLLRGRLTIGCGLAGGLAALAGVTTFAMRDSPSGGVAWLQIATGLGLAAILAALLLKLKGRGRVHAAGVVGAVGAVVSLSSLSVFWHGVVISALPATPARLICGLALVCGVAGAGLSFLPEAGASLPGKR
jgi:hypothetical protein